MTRWLTDDEQASWLALAGVMLRLNTALDQQLQRDSSLTHFEYLTLAMLSAEPEWTTTMSDLARTVNASPSRLSHVVRKLEERGWVARSPSPQSRRVTVVRLTQEGYDVLAEAAPGHVGTVASLVFDGLGAEDVEQLRRLMTHVLERLEASGLDASGC
jgi:DNA-binding MarR family transcriptional regulator